MTEKKVSKTTEAKKLFTRGNPLLKTSYIYAGLTNKEILERVNREIQDHIFMIAQDIRHGATEKKAVSDRNLKRSYWLSLKKKYTDLQDKIDSEKEISRRLKSGELQIRPATYSDYIKCPEPRTLWQSIKSLFVNN